MPLPHSLVKDLVGLREVQVAQRVPGEFEFRMVPGPDINRAAVQARALANVERFVGPGQVVTFREMARVPAPRPGRSGRQYVSPVTGDDVAVNGIRPGSDHGQSVWLSPDAPPVILSPRS